MMQSDLKSVLYRESEIAARLDELAIQITADYSGKELTSFVASLFRSN
jgi:hypoxanthine-guanine phosphoribosyltransferase